MDDQPEQNFDDLLAWVQGRVDRWEQHRKENYDEKWKEYYRLWRGIHADSDKTRQSERSKLISPALQQAVKMAVSELEEATFGRTQWFDIQDDFADPQKQDIEIMRNLLLEDLNKGNAKSGMADIFLYGALYGTGIGELVLEDKTDLTPADQPVPGTISVVRGVQEKTYTSVRLNPVSPLNFVIDPAATYIDEALGCAVCVDVPKHTIIEGRVS